MDSLFSLQLDLPAGNSSPTILPLFGGANKPIEEMTADEQRWAADQVYQKVREAAFSRGLPVIIKIDGQVVKQFADGHIELIS